MVPTSLPPSLHVLREGNLLNEMIGSHPRTLRLPCLRCRWKGWRAGGWGEMVDPRVVEAILAYDDVGNDGFLLAPGHLQF